MAQSIQPLVQASKNPNVQAFLQMLRFGEGTVGDKGYKTMFTGTRFESFDKHPNQLNAAGSLKSTAAGAYQFLYSTWSNLVKQYGFHDFSPPTQDLGAIALIAGRKALDDVLAGRFDEAVVKTNREWASLPGSPYGQPTVTLEKARALYEKAGGKFAPVENAPAIQMPTPIALPVKETTVAPFIALALPAILEAVPKLASLFSSGSAVSQRNEAAAATVVNIAKTAINAANEQDLVEKLQSDPAAAATVQQAMEDHWFQIHEATEKSVAAAREFVTTYTAQKDVRTVLGSGLTFPELLSLIFVGISAIGAGIVLVMGDYSAEIKGAVITLMLVAGYTGVREFWFGSSPAEQAKVKQVDAMRPPQ